MIHNIFSTSLLIASIAYTAQALPVYEMHWSADGSREYAQVTLGTQSPQQGFQAYDNFRNPSTIHGLYRMNGDEVADDLFMATTGPSRLTDLAYTIANTSATQTLLSYRVTIRFYDENRTLLFTDPDTIRIPIPPQSAIGIFTDSNFYTRYGVTVPPHIFMSLQFSEAVGADSTDVGCILVGPRTIGYSTQFAYDFTSGATLDFDGSDQTNMMFFVDTVAIPAPGAAISLCCTLPFALRRRR